MLNSYSSDGIVYIIGAGPGDPGLITVKGLDRLRQADVVLYDRLIPQELLLEVSPFAELIDVGKEPKRHRRSQDEINALLIEKAGQGKSVARLKGGDPFVFGRGGEECQALAEAGIRYEVIPGVSSVIAVPAYAGIPVTQRNVTTSFTVIAGHTGGSEADVDWASIPRNGTIIFVMGVEHMPQIVLELISRGFSPETPAAVIEKGTTPNQVVVTATLSDIVEKAAHMQPPSILIVGEVVRLHEELNWFNLESASSLHSQGVLVEKQ
ncbi:MAG: uroporphyrinogen-III C-methyltransferase [Anaerolineales bacterium]|nr:uroporphyrinogen-III C-methyltransferase [Anaerolineales bacterium]